MRNAEQIRHDLAIAQTIVYFSKNNDRFKEIDCVDEIELDFLKYYTSCYKKLEKIYDDVILDFPL